MQLAVSALPYAQLGQQAIRPAQHNSNTGHSGLVSCFVPKQCVAVRPSTCCSAGGQWPGADRHQLGDHPCANAARHEPRQETLTSVCGSLQQHQAHGLPLDLSLASGQGLSLAIVLRDTTPLLHAVDFCTNARNLARACSHQHSRPAAAAALQPVVTGGDAQAALASVRSPMGQLSSLIQKPLAHELHQVACASASQLECQHWPISDNGAHAAALPLRRGALPRVMCLSVSQPPAAQPVDAQLSTEVDSTPHNGASGSLQPPASSSSGGSHDSPHEPHSSQADRPHPQPQEQPFSSITPIASSLNGRAGARTSSNSTSTNSSVTTNGGLLLPPQQPPATYLSTSGDSDTPGMPVLAPRTPRRRMLMRPPRPIPSDQEADTSDEPSRLQQQQPEGLPLLPGSPQQGQWDAGDSDEEGGLGTQQLQYLAFQPTPQARIARALPMELIPQSPQHPLLCPESYTPLTSASATYPQQQGSQQHASTNGSGHQPAHNSNQESSSAAFTRGGVALPLLGPWVLTNHPRSFRAADAAVDYQVGPAHAQARLAIRLEYVTQRTEEEDEESAIQAMMQGDAQAHARITGRAGRPPPVAQLQLFNISRRRRGHHEEAVVFVHSPASWAEGRGRTQAAVRPGDRGLVLRPGDIITLGSHRSAPQFRVAVLSSGPPTEAAVLDTMLQRYGNRRAGSGTIRQGPASVPQAVLAAAQVADAGGLLTLRQLTQVARAFPDAADVGYRTALAGPERVNAFAWIAWAQLSMRRGAQRQARDLFRAALAAAAPASLEATPFADSEASAAAYDPHMQPNQLAMAPTGTITTPDLDRGTSSTQLPGNPPSLSAEDRAPGLVPVYAWPLPGEPQLAPQQADQQDGTAEGGGNVVAVVQALFTWGRFEWNVTRLRGAARHLWRAAADASYLHMGGPAAGGLGMILHTWVLGELELDNVYNARVVVAEGLRKCPDDQALFVAAANVELEGATQLAREFCLRAYELDRMDKQLYLVWPRVMAALGERDKARVLFERGLEYHPMNTKILGAYAKFEAEAGDVEFAMDLHDRALAIDSTSITSMHNRTAWARLEADLGDLSAAQELLEEGLELHPTYVPALLGLARVMRLAGRWSAAQDMLRTAQRFTHQHNTEVLREKALLLRALGEREMSLAIEAHLRGISRVTSAKRAGVSSYEAWQMLLADSRHPFRQQLARAAYERKRELGWLEAPGVAGPRGARRASAASPRGVAFVPLADPPTPAAWEQSVDQNDTPGGRRLDGADEPVLGTDEEVSGTGSALATNSEDLEQHDGIPPLLGQRSSPGHESDEDEELPVMISRDKGQVRNGGLVLAVQDDNAGSGAESEGEGGVRAPELARSRAGPGWASRNSLSREEGV